MIKFIVAVVVTALLAFACSLFFPWWSISVAAFIVALAIPQRSFWSFLSGFSALFLLWGGWATTIDMPNRHILSRRIADLFYLGHSSLAIILVTALVGAFVAGLASLTASFLHRSAVSQAI